MYQTLTVLHVAVHTLHISAHLSLTEPSRGPHSCSHCADTGLRGRKMKFSGQSLAGEAGRRTTGRRRAETLRQAAGCPP